MRKRTRRVVLAAVGAGALLIIVVLGIWRWQGGGERAASEERASAEARWTQRGFGHYQLTLTDKGCTQVIEVRRERVVDVASNRCEPPPRSVTDLFALIRRNGTVSTPCIAQRCACDDVLTVTAMYHPQLGYPQAIDVSVASQPNPRHADYWRAAASNLKLPRCDSMAVGSKEIRIISVTPLPEVP